MKRYDIRSGARSPEPFEDTEDTGTAAEGAERPWVEAYPIERPGAPAIVVLPGGGYAGQAAHEAEPIARWLNGLGIHAFVLYYRVAPDRHPKPLLDARRAIRWVRRHAEQWGVDASRVGVLGFSAGGHLAGCLATGVRPTDGLADPPGRAADAELDDRAPDAVDELDADPALAILCYPVIIASDDEPSGSIVNLTGYAPSETSEVARAARRALSLPLRVDERTAASFVWHTADDEAVPVENALAYADAMARARRPIDLHVYAHGRHGVGLADTEPLELGPGGEPIADEDLEGPDDVRDWPLVCAGWLRTKGWAYRRGPVDPEG